MTWTERSTWPDDSKDGQHVFLGNAIDAVGRAMHGLHWTGREPSDPHPRTYAPRWQDASEREWQEILPHMTDEARLLLHHKDLQIQWSQALQSKTRGIEAGRFHRVAQTLSNSILAEHLDSYVLCDDVFHPIHKSFWRVKESRVRFDSLAMCTSDPFATGREGGADCGAIYVGRAALEQLCAKVAAETHAGLLPDAPSSDRPILGKKKRGRKPGSKNWDATPFLRLYRRLLEERGQPVKQNVRGWTSKNAAASTVLEDFCEGLNDPNLQPSLNTALAWAEEAISDWVSAGCPRVTPTNKFKK